MVEDVMRLARRLSVSLQLHDCIDMCRHVSSSSSSSSSDAISKADFLAKFSLEKEATALLPAACGDDVQEVKVWMCTFCDFLNPGEEDFCLQCHRDPWGGVRREAKPARDQWECQSCKFFNSNSLYFCEVCGAGKPTLANTRF